MNRIFLRKVIVILVLISVIVLISRESFVDSIKRKADEVNLKAWHGGDIFQPIDEKLSEKSANIRKSANMVNKVMEYGGYATGAIGLVLLLAGLIKQESQ